MYCTYKVVHGLLLSIVHHVFQHTTLHTFSFFFAMYILCNIQSEALASSGEVGTYIQLKLRYVSI